MDNAQEFGIRVASNPEQREHARILVEQMYRWRGYTRSEQEPDRTNCIIHNASESGEVIGTATLCVDSVSGLFADDTFKDYLNALRHADSSLCEICRLAFKTTNASKTILGALFHVMFIYAHHLNNCTDAVIQVNPRHKKFYEKMLGFTTLSEIRINTHTNAPAYLLWLDLNDMAAQIRRSGGTASLHDRTESLYPYFFSRGVEAGIIRRLTATSSTDHIGQV